MPLKETLKRWYYRTRGPMAYLGAVAGLAVFLVWLLSALDIRIPKVDLEPETVLFGILILVMYALLWLVVLYRQRYRVLKLKLDTRDKASAERKARLTRPESNPPGRIQVVRLPRPPVSSGTVLSRPEGRVLMKRTFILRRDEIWDYKIKGRTGAVLDIHVKSSSPVDVLLLDEWHYLRENYDNPEEEESDALDAEFRVECKKDCYYLMVMNEGQKNAQVEIEGRLE